MSYQTERSAIETYFQTEWAGATPVGFDLHEFTPAANSVLLTIESGEVFQGTVGQSVNRLDYTGMITFQIFTDSGKGSAAARGYAETILSIFRGVIIDNSGVAITTPSAAFVRFSPQDQHPRILSTDVQFPFTIMTVTVPFVRYDNQ